MSIRYSAEELLYPEEHQERKVDFIPLKDLKRSWRLSRKKIREFHRKRYRIYITRDIFYRKYRKLVPPYDEDIVELIIPYLRKRYPYISRRLGKKQLVRQFYERAISRFFELVIRKIIEGHVVKLGTNQIYMGVFMRESRFSPNTTIHDLIVNKSYAPTPLMIKFYKNEIHAITFLEMKHDYRTEIQRKIKYGFEYTDFNEFTNEHVARQIHKSQGHSRRFREKLQEHRMGRDGCDRMVPACGDQDSP